MHPSREGEEVRCGAPLLLLLAMEDRDGHSCTLALLTLAKSSSPQLMVTTKDVQIPRLQ